MTGVIFQDVNLADANLRDANVTGLQIINTNLCGAVLPDGESGACPRPVRR
ncbi:MAG: pentapeptide repeat-containing protein [Spirulinaceae cyanobacterium RM2_2_10]|nr:pentapeptide repeat-containing protein [Spirulinaceae cyanobacterium RM2_2_10]